MSPRKLHEGDPIAPVVEVKTAGLHERDYFIGCSLSSATDAWLQKPGGGWLLSEDDIADRACRIAAKTMVRKEVAP